MYINLPEAAEDPVEDGRVYPPDDVARHAVRVLEVHGHEEVLWLGQ